METPCIPNTLNEMRIEEICRDVARDTTELYEKEILKNGDPAQRDERCLCGYLLPVHLHNYKRTTARDGTVTVIREILVNCTQCTAPTIMELGYLLTIDATQDIETFFVFDFGKCYICIFEYYVILCMHIFFFLQHI